MITQLKLKVAEITQNRVIPFSGGVHGRSWLRWFKIRHPTLSVWVAQGLDTSIAKGLTSAHCKTSYDNLTLLYRTHNYATDHIWNSDEIGCSTRCERGSRVIAKRRSRDVYMTIPQNKEWLIVNVCINIATGKVHLFYIFKEVQIQQKYIEGVEVRACMAIQKKAWMTTYLFKQWLSFFQQSIPEGISPANCHLLVLDGHGSHVGLEAMEQAKTMGLDIITLPSHTSHALQPLNVSCFKPFKTSRCSEPDKPMWLCGSTKP